MGEDKEDKKGRETKLELEIQECSYMVLHLENLKNSRINLGTEEVTKIEIGEIFSISEKDVICGLTRKPCILYTPESAGHPSYINYHYLKRCPDAKDSSKKYKLDGIKLGHVFYISDIKRLKE